MARSSSSNNASTSSRSKQTSTKTTSQQSQAKKQKQGNVDQMKYEIAGEFGVQLGADATARENGQVGGEITKRLVSLAKKNMKNEE